MPGKNILFMMSASVACFKACSVLSALVKKEHAVQTAITPRTLQFVGPATLQGLTGRAVYSDMFAPRQSGTEHISLAKWADIAVLCPASADVINKMAAGVADDCVTTLFLAHDFAKPFLIVPAMNTRMFLHPATQGALEKLRSWGVQVLQPQTGHLACGDDGPGRMPEPESVVKKIEELLA